MTTMTASRVREIETLALRVRERHRFTTAHPLRVRLDGTRLSVTLDEAKHERGTLPLDEGAWHELRALLRAAGFRREPEENTWLGKAYTQARANVLLRRGELLVRVEGNGFMGISAEFFAAYDRSHSSGARYSFEKLKQMRIRERAIFYVTADRIRSHFVVLGYLDETAPTLRWARERIEYDLRSCCHFKEFPEQDSDREDPKVGDQWRWNAVDRDGRRLVNGQARAFYDHEGRLRYGRVYHRLNNQWLVEVSPRELAYVSTFDLFTYQGPAAHPRRVPPLIQLRRHVAAAVAAEDYERARCIARERDRRYPGRGQVDAKPKAAA